MRFRRDDHEHDEGTGRIEAFSDGVFAIAITLLIIEIGVPLVTDVDSLKDGLYDLWPKYFAYVLSFLIIGIASSFTAANPGPLWHLTPPRFSGHLTVARRSPREESRMAR